MKTYIRTTYHPIGAIIERLLLKNDSLGRQYYTYSSCNADRGERIIEAKQRRILACVAKSLLTTGNTWREI